MPVKTTDWAPYFAIRINIGVESLVDFKRGRMTCVQIFTMLEGEEKQRCGIKEAVINTLKIVQQFSKNISIKHTREL